MTLREFIEEANKKPELLDMPMAFNIAGNTTFDEMMEDYLYFKEMKSDLISPENCIITISSKRIIGV